MSSIKQRPRPTPADAWLTSPNLSLPARADHRDFTRSPQAQGRPDKQRPPGQRGINCVLMRGGTSKGLFFLARDLPPRQDVRDRVLLAALGSPDRRQIDGLGGGDSLTSKVAIVAPSVDPQSDVDYLFAQVVVDRPVVDTSPTCGNILAGVATFAIEEGLVLAQALETTVRIRAVNNSSYVEAIVQTPGGRVQYEGAHHIDGVPGTAAPIVLNFRNMVGAKTGSMLPTGNAIDVVDGIEVTCMDVAMPVVLLRAADVGRTGHESHEDFNRHPDPELMGRLEFIRRQASQLMGMGDATGKVVPKIALLSRPQNGGTITSRYFVPEKCHASHAVTGAICVASSVAIEGTVATGLVGSLPSGVHRVSIEHPAGKLHVQLIFRDGQIQKAGVVSTARRLFEGRVLVPRSVWDTPTY